MPDPASNGSSRMSRTIKLVIMGAGAAALLYSCAPGISGGLGALPYLWFFGNPFYRGPATTSTTTPPGSTATTPGTTQTQPSQRGGFGGSTAEHGTTGTT